MKKVLGLFLFLCLLILAILVGYSLLKPPGKGALQVTANVNSKVFLNGKLLGKTPICKCKGDDTIKEGLFDIKVIPEDSSLTPFVTKAKITGGALTAIDRTFRPGALSSAYMLTLEKTSTKDPQLMVLSIPEGALISLDSTPQGITPYQFKFVTPSEHELEIYKTGFNKKTVRLRAVENYNLIAHIYLGAELEKQNTSTQSANLEASASASITIKQTPTGFLRVRESPNISAKEIQRVMPGETYNVILEQDEWYQIKLLDGTTGWISTQYAEKVKNP